MTLVGVAVDGPWKGDEIGPNLVVQRIDGVATQEYIRIPIAGTVFAEADRDRDRPMVLVRGQTYRCYGSETGGFVGDPPGTAPDSVQQTEYLFRCLFVLNWGVKPEAVKPVAFAPADFLNRPALLTGTAVNVDYTGYLVGTSWRCDAGSKWPDWMVGKPVEVEGTVRAGPIPDEFQFEQPARRLSRLEDQVGRPVELHGRALSGNDDWWLDYRGESIEVPGMDRLPGWSESFRGKAVTIRGTLVRHEGTDFYGQPVRFCIDRPSWSPAPPLKWEEQSLDPNGVRD